MSKKLTYEEVKTFIENKGYKLLSTEYINAQEKLKVQCPKGHEYEVKYGNFYSGRRCPECYKEINLHYEGYTYLEVCGIFKQYGFELVSNKYDNMMQKLYCKDSIGYLYNTNLSNLIINKNPSLFFNSNPYTIQNIKLWCKLNNKPFILLSNNCTNSVDNLLWQCLKCQCNFYASWSFIYNRGFGCPYCAGKQVSKINCFATYHPELIEEWNFVKNGDLTPYDITYGNNTIPIWWKCKECGHEWKTVANKRHQGRDCPECKMSKGEKRIKKFLELNRFIYQPQKIYTNLLGLGNCNLSYDFYLPDYNLLIEYQGIQHEQPTDFKGDSKKQSQKAFIKQQEHDRRKREYAKQNNIDLLEIWYWDFDNIEDILSNKLNINKLN